MKNDGSEKVFTSKDARKKKEKHSTGELSIAINKILFTKGFQIEEST